MRLVASQPGKVMVLAVGRELLDSPEYHQLLELARTLANMGRAPFTVRDEKLTHTSDDLGALVEYILTIGRKGWTLQRYKGLGEMNPSQLWDTTLNPAIRTLMSVTLADAEGANDTFEMLMGEEVEPRRKYIEENAHAVQNLDI